MGKIERNFEREQVTAPGKYARVMHHIGGFGGKNDNSDMMRGGEDELNLVTEKDMRATGLDDAGIKRLFDLGSLRMATADEVERFEINTGVREANANTDAYTNFTTGNETLNPAVSKTGAIPQGGGSSEADDKGKDKQPPAGGANAASASGFGQAGGGSEDDEDDEDDDTAGAGGTGGAPSGGSASYKGMTKGELSEYTVPELKDFAKDEKDGEGNPLIPGFQTMVKDDLLNALVALNK